MAQRDGNQGSSGRGAAGLPPADGAATIRGRPAPGSKRQPIDPLTRARAPDTIDDPLDEIPTDSPASAARGEQAPTGHLLGATKRDEENPFLDDPTIDAEAAPDEPTLRDSGVIPLPSMATAETQPSQPRPSQARPMPAADPVAEAVAPASSGIDVRVPPQPVKERRRPTVPLSVGLAAPGRAGGANGASARSPNQPGRPRRPTASYQGVAAKPQAREHRSLRTMFAIGVAIIAALTALGLLWLL